MYCRIKTLYSIRIYDEFLDKLVAKAEKIKLGAPMDKDTQMGPLNSFKQLENIEKNIKATVNKVERLDVVEKDQVYQIKDIIFRPQ